MGVYIGPNLRRLLSERGLTQERLAEGARMTRTDINRIANDKLALGPARLERIAAALDVSVLELSPEAEPDEPGQSLLDRLAALEAKFAAEQRRRERALRAVTRRLAELEAALAPREQQADPRTRGGAAT